MKLQALSYYNGDKDTRYGDCILLYDNASLIVYDCGHTKHADTVKAFLQSNLSISGVHIVVSHNDSDHTDGVCELLDWLYDQSKYKVSVYSHQYLKHVDTILDKIDDGRRTRESLKKSLLAEFDNIKIIIETAQAYSFPVVEALSGTSVGNATIVGPTVDEFTDVAAKAVDSRESNNIGEGHAEETVMNAASVQLKCKLDNAESILLCGDASPTYLHNLNNYKIIQLPHHGQLDDAQAIFEELKESYTNTYLISDNTGSGATSGGSDNLVQYMKDELYSPAMNTKNGVVCFPQSGFGSIPSSKPQGVRLGEMDFKCW
ncbi:MAG: MBL fold metallo-hydrolase [Parabacteroides sp.]|nr:MBL fold metallo-hydrolase [Parabacteroides sp.]